MRLYNLERGQGTIIHARGVEVVFGHIDGLYSLCWVKDSRPRHFVHLMAGTELKAREDGSYDVVGKVMLPPGNILET